MLRRQNSLDWLTNSNTTTPSGRQLYHLQFSLQAASPDTFGYVLVYLHEFLTSALDGGEWSVHAPTALPPVNGPGTHWIGGWEGPKGSLDTVVVKRKISSVPSLGVEPQSSSP
jgi:hypothetical protein